ncbi:MAG: hypothetical protein HY558_05060 [Euryarchaeota archaeon]|nr:hypothetical protein [Euryarchaeota archaeon]
MHLRVLCLIGLLLASAGLPAAASHGWCQQHYDGPWWQGKWWVECHTNLSDGADGAHVHHDIYIDPNYGIAYRENNFYIFDVVRVANTSPAGIRNLRVDPWIPYEPDFYPVTDWTPYQYTGPYPSPDTSTYYKTDKNPAYGPNWTARPDWKGTNVTFGGAAESRFVDAYYYQGATGPSGGYYQARYPWDYTALGTFLPAQMVGNKWLLKSTPWVRPGSYVLDYTLAFHYDVVNLTTPTPACDIAFTKESKPNSEKGTQNSRGTLMTYLTLTAPNTTTYTTLRITDETPTGFVLPSSKEVQVWTTDGHQRKAMKSDDYTLTFTGDQMTLTFSPASLDTTRGYLVKYPARYDKSTDPRAYITITTLEGDNPDCKSTYETNLLLKD